MQDTELLEKMFRGETTINLSSKGDKPRPLNHTILAEPFRNYFIKQKKFLMKAVIILAKRYPTATKENTTGDNTHEMLDIIKEFRSFNSNRVDFFDALFRILINEHEIDEQITDLLDGILVREEFLDSLLGLVPPESEHDGFYRGRLQWFIEEIIKAILNGKWEARLENYMSGKSGCWSEPLPNGGKYSIVSKMIEKRQQIKNLLGYRENEEVI